MGCQVCKSEVEPIRTKCSTQHHFECFIVECLLFESYTPQVSNQKAVTERESVQSIRQLDASERPRELAEDAFDRFFKEIPTQWAPKRQRKWSDFVKGEQESFGNGQIVTKRGKEKVEGKKKAFFELKSPLEQTPPGRPPHREEEKIQGIGLESPLKKMAPNGFVAFPRVVVGSNRNISCHEKDLIESVLSQRRASGIKVLSNPDEGISERIKTYSAIRFQ